MVVIRKSTGEFKKLHSKEIYSDLEDYADIIGYSFESDKEEIRIELNPDRPDLMSFSTLISSCRNYFNPSEWKEYSSNVNVKLILDSTALKLRPYVFGFTAFGKNIGDNFDDLIDFQEKIHLTVGKNRKKSSIGIHDFDRIKNPFRFDSAEADKITFTTYDGTVTGTAAEILKKHPKGIDYANLLPEGKRVPLIMDSADDVLSLPPVINGKKSMVSSETKNFFVDITGTDRNASIGTAFLMMNYFRSLDYDVKTVHISSETGNQNDEIKRYQKREIVITLREIEEFIGLPVEDKTVISVLGKMGFNTLSTRFPITVRIPPHRVDIMGPADIFEDLAKGIGYDKIEAMPISLGTIGSRNKRVEFSNLVREILPGAGFQEAITYVIGSNSKYRNTEYTGDVEILNPKSLDFSVVRDRLSLNLMELYQNNRARTYPQNLFEIGEVLNKGKQSGKVAISTASSKATFSEIKRVADYLCRRLFGKVPELESKDTEMFIPGRSALLKVNGKEIGIMGEIAPVFLEQFSLKVPVSLAELDLDAMYSIFHALKSGS